MNKITAIVLLSLIALFQSCSSASRSVAQEKKKNTMEEKKHHYPALRRVDRY